MDGLETKFDVFFTLFFKIEFFQVARKIAEGLKKSTNLLGTHWHKIRFLVTCWVFYRPHGVRWAKKKLKIFLAWEQKKPCQVVGNIFVNNFVIDFDFPTPLLLGDMGVWSFFFKRLFFLKFSLTSRAARPSIHHRRWCLGSLNWSHTSLASFGTIPLPMGSFLT